MNQCMVDTYIGRPGRYPRPQCSDHRHRQHGCSWCEAAALPVSGLHIDSGSVAAVTYLGYDIDVNVSGLLGGIGWGPIVGVGIGQCSSLPTSRLVGDLLPGRSFTFLTRLYLILVLAI